MEATTILTQGDMSNFRSAVRQDGEIDIQFDPSTRGQHDVDDTLDTQEFGVQSPYVVTTQFLVDPFRHQDLDRTDREFR